MQISKEGALRPGVSRDTAATEDLACQARSLRGKKAELVELLLERKVPEKDDIIRTKGLIRDLAQAPEVDHPRPGEVKEFIAAYLDLYVGRMTADPVIENGALRRCLRLLGAGGGSGPHREGRPAR